MNDPTTSPRSRFTARLCTAAAICWAILAVCFLLQPAALSPGISFPRGQSLADLEAFWAARPSEVPVHIALHVAALVTALATLGVIGPLARRAGTPWAHWAGISAMVGAGVMALANVRYLALEPVYTQLYSAEPEFGAELALASAQLGLDPYGILEFGTLGLFVAAATAGLARQRRSMWLIALGGVATAGLLGMVIGAIAFEPLLDLAAPIGTPALCGWLIAAGRALKGDAGSRIS
jgi:hypothetical protein